MENLPVLQERIQTWNRHRPSILVKPLSLSVSLSMLKGNVCDFGGGCHTKELQWKMYHTLQSHSTLFHLEY